MSIANVLPDLSFTLVKDLVNVAASDWEQNTGMTLGRLVENDDPLFQLIHRKLIFQFFTERVQEFLKEDTQKKALEIAQEDYFRQFEQLCIEKL
ncbi:MAG: hypothetical protein RBG13Loki_2679 [Promethearchaeota archaeon CR_4]|nr:MAG: hypothetical protein RBG13Loki_2679 [Candidatus Lokiarchaeota archaeon CR_4]